MKTDTIAAVATALSDSGIGIVRISGGEAITVVDKIFKNPAGKHILKNAKSHTIHYGFIYDEDKVADEVMVSFMKAPKSYTAEDTVEINCHGGVLMMQKILEIVCKNGARIAQPGEFTKRAFLNGRIDLSKAEAVMDLIHSQNEYAMKASMDQLNGRLYEKIKRLRSDIIYEIAFIESALDDPEHISLCGYPERLLENIEKMSQEIDGLLATFINGKLIKEGIATVILGKPNVGKSSLMNLLLGEDRAIVTDIEGTTRDVLQESVRFHGIHLKLIDTAGIRNTEDIVEKIGVDKAKKYASDADLVLYVVDTSKKLDDNDRDILSLIRDKNVIILLNKTDLETVTDEKQILDELQKKGLNQDSNCDTFKRNFDIVKVSAKEGTGMKELEEAVKNMFLSGVIKDQNEVMITNLRHKEALQEAYDSLNLVKKSIEDGMPEDFYSIDLMNAYKKLGLIIGEEVEDDLVEEIFSKFCMGK